MYEQGLGVQLDNTQAIAWYQKAAAQGDNVAKLRLALLNDQIAGAQLLPATNATVALASATGTTSADSPAGSIQISPVFSQLVALLLPKGFVQSGEHTTDRFYLREFVLTGETLERWTQMISVSGSEGGASISSTTPIKNVQRLAAGYARSCPATANAIELGSFNVGTYHAYAGVLSCGTNLKLATPQSESALVISVVGTHDLYTIQWAVRAAPSPAKLPLQKNEWETRLRQLQPIKLCPVVPGESAPYPSCLAAPPARQ
jgi:hypothetical protein